jgi:hypothetical protein
MEGRGLVDLAQAMIATGLEQEDPEAFHLREVDGQRAAAGAGADDDVVEFIGIVAAWRRAFGATA